MNQPNDYVNKPEDLRRAQDLCVGLSSFGWNEFAQSLIEFFNERRFLTEKQMQAGESMLKKARENDWGTSNPPLPVVRLEENELEEPGETIPDPISIEEEEPF